MHIFFDILGTLLTEQGDPRPHAREVLLKLAGTGHGVYLWSTAGEGYAACAARTLGVEDIIGGVASSGIAGGDQRGLRG